MILAGTGHRPPKLGGYGKEADDRLFSFCLEFVSYYSIEYVIDKWISGGALGFDFQLANACACLNKPFSFYLPFDGYNDRWPREKQIALEGIAQLATEVKYICEPGYDPSKMQIRNEAMVTDCNVVIALYNGSPGGTRNCIYYANCWRAGKPVVNLWQAWEQFQKGESVTWPELTR